MALGGAYAATLYFRSLRNKEVETPKWMLVALATLRWLGVSLLALLLLNPLLKYVERFVEKPTVFIAVDRSESLAIGGDSAYVKESFETDLEGLKKDLGEKFELVELGVAPNSGNGFTDKSTDLADYFSEAMKFHQGRNASALVMISDGIFNRGINPAFVANRLNVPVYTVPLGDTLVRKDVGIYSAKANSITFLGNEFPVEVVVNATKASGQNVKLSLWQGSTMMASTDMTITGNRFSKSHTFMLDAKKTGMQHYRVVVSGLANELNQANNSKSVYTEVLDSRQKVLVLAHAPHPDVAALRTAIESNDQYEMTLEVGKFSPVKKGDYDLVITHQLPVEASHFNLMQSLKENKIPLFAFVGTSTNIDMLNRLNIGVSITGNRSNFNQGLSLANSEFSLFEPESELMSFINEVPPLTTPFGEYNVPPTSNVLIYQKIGNVRTEMPLWFFNKDVSYRTGVCSGEGIWRWKLYEYEQRKEHKNISDILQKSIQYLALKDDKRTFKVYTSARSFFENERISFLAEVYNESYEFTDKAEVKVKLKHEGGKQYEYNLLPQQSSYTYGVSSLPAGNYTFEATSQLDGKLEKVQGEFLVKELQLERINLTANYALMNQIAEETGGEMFGKTEWASLSEKLLGLPQAVSISRTSQRYRDLISQKWIFFLVFGLLVVEWFARRFYGGY